MSGKSTNPPPNVEVDEGRRRRDHGNNAALMMPVQGFSPRNLKYMRSFAEAWPDRALVQRTVAQIPWRSNLTLLEKLKGSELRLWCAQRALINGWRNNLTTFRAI